MRKAFTLVELLAVIVILAVILVIAVPRITDTITASKKAAFESSTKLVASTLERNYQSALASETTFATSGSCASYVDSSEYDSCTYTITDGVATVTLKGKSGGKFDKLKCTGTKVSATATQVSTVTFDFEDASLGSFTVDEGTTWADWILSYHMSSADNGIVWVEDGTNILYVEIGNGLWVNAVYDTQKHGYALVGDTIKSITYQISGPS